MNKISKISRYWKKGGIVPVAVLGAVTFFFLFQSAGGQTPLFSPWLPPGDGHLLGTNDVGQDIFFQLISAGGRSVMVGLIAAFTATLVGTFTGCMAGYYRGITDRIIMGIADIFLLIPDIPLVIVLVSFFDPGLFNVIIVIAMTSWSGTARVVRARVLSIKASAFVLNARSLGAGDGHILLRHILPHTGELVLAKATLAVAGAMLTETGISFLGLGDPCQPTWGSMLHGVFAGAGLINGYWWWYLPPVLCICVTVMGFNLAGLRLQSGWRGGVPALEPINRALHKRETKHPWNHTRHPAVPVIRYPVSPPHSANALFTIHNLDVLFSTPRGKSVKALDGVNLSLEKGERMAIIGESGSGKSLLFLAMLGLLPENSRMSGRLFFRGKPINLFSRKQFQHLRAWEVSYVPQGAGNALNPVIKLGHQVSERMRVHGGMSKKKGMEMATALLRKTGISQARQRAHHYPHQFSGGMNQRVLLAMAMAGKSSVVLADEPTKGLDPKTKKEVLRLFLELDREAMAVVTHDLWFAEKFATTIVVMNKGVVLECAPAGDFFKGPCHPYSRSLLKARPWRTQRR